MPKGGGGRGGTCPPRFWQIRRRRRQAATRRITVCPPQIFRLWHMPELKGLKRDDRSSKGNQSFGNNLNALVTDLQWYFFSVFTFHCSLYQTNVNKICSENSCKKIYVVILNNPIIRTLWKFSLNFQIYVMYNLKNQACNNY